MAPWTLPIGQRGRAIRKTDEKIWQGRKPLLHQWIQNMRYPQSRFLKIILALGLLLNCQNKPFHGGATSKEVLVSSFIAALSQENTDLVRTYLIRKQEFVEDIHPYTPEAKNISGEEWWNTMIIRRRDALTTGLLHKFKGKTCSATITGPEKKKEHYGPIKFYRQIPIKIICGDNDNVYKDENNSIFGIVVEKGGVFKILNIFSD